MADRAGPANYKENQKKKPWGVFPEQTDVEHAEDMSNARERTGNYGSDKPRRYGSEDGRTVEVDSDPSGVNLNPDEHEVKDNFKALRKALLGVK